MHLHRTLIFKKCPTKKKNSNYFTILKEYTGKKKIHENLINGETENIWILMKGKIVAMTSDSSK